MKQGISVPQAWQRMGLALARRKQGWIREGVTTLFRSSLLPIPEFITAKLSGTNGSFAGLVVGDPCIVWDEEIKGWRMFLFALTPGHGQAVCFGQDTLSLTKWQMEGPLKFANVDDLPGRAAYKPFIVMDAFNPNHAARINGRYCLLFVTNHKAKFIMRAWSESLAGPWKIDRGPLIPVGEATDFDGKHVDAVSGYYFAERDEILYFYMGYPRQRQPRAQSPFGSAQAVACEPIKERRVTKLGPILPPSQRAGHWASGWVGGLQLLPGRDYRWIAVINASPTSPNPADTSISKEEPPPSLGGFAYCDEEWPVRAWRFFDEPIEYIDKIPDEALQAGEAVNFWRQHILVLPDNRLALFYNSGEYFKEQIYLKVST